VSETPAAMEAPEQHGHAHHGTGVRWLDMTLALAAFVTSLVSIWLAIQHGHDMSRLVQANSLPYLQLYTSDLENDLKTQAFRFTVENQGVGPARIAEVTVTVNGRPVNDLNALLDACCAPGLLKAAAAGKTSFGGIDNDSVITSTLRDRMIRPGQSIDAIDWRVTLANAAAVQSFRRGVGRGSIKGSICYCSVFDECWTRGFGDRKPQPVASCPVAAVAYRQ
jgi:hypothetical protein